MQLAFYDVSSLVSITAALSRASFQLDHCKVDTHSISPLRDVAFSPRSSTTLLCVSIPGSSDLVSPLRSSVTEVIIESIHVKSDLANVMPYSSIDFFCFMVLDIGSPVIDSIPLGTRFAVGLLQATDVRASGFSVVPPASLAPAVQYVCSSVVIARAHYFPRVMYVIMMYISVCAYTSTR